MVTGRRVSFPYCYSLSESDAYRTILDLLVSSSDCPDFLA